MKKTPLKRKTPFRRRVKPEQAKYLKRRQVYLQEHPKCLSYQYPIPNEMAMGCTDASQDIHHRAKRGRLLNDERFWLPVCRACHDYIEDHKKMAREIGLLIDPRTVTPHNNDTTTS